MRVELHLFASLSRCLPERRRGNLYAMEIPEGTTVTELLQRPAIPAESGSYVVIVR